MDNKPRIDSSDQPKAESGEKYDLVAPFYPILERLVFRSQLDTARSAFFEAILPANQILLVGEGNGRFLKSLLARKTGGCVKIVEKSPAMIRFAKERIRGLGEKVRCDLEFIETDFRRFISDSQFDCVVSHFFLDQFNPPAQGVMIKRFAELTATNGIWINVDFTPPNTPGDRALMWLQYAFFKILSRIEAVRCFEETASAAQAGWRPTGTSSFLNGLVVAKRYEKAPTTPETRGTRQ